MYPGLFSCPPAWPTVSASSEGARRGARWNLGLRGHLAASVPLVEASPSCAPPPGNPYFYIWGTRRDVFNYPHPWWGAFCLWRFCRVCDRTPGTPDRAGRGASILIHTPVRSGIRIPFGIGQWGGAAGLGRSATLSGRRHMRRRATHVDFAPCIRLRREALSARMFRA